MLAALLWAPATLSPEQLSLLAADEQPEGLVLWRGRRAVWGGENTTTHAEVPRVEAQDTLSESPVNAPPATRVGLIDDFKRFLQDTVSTETALRQTALGGRAVSLSLNDVNRLYDTGHPTNNISEAGLLIHQHDNTERKDENIYTPGRKFRYHWATSLINRQMPGLYNHECGVILAPAEARVLCSYYADFVSWTEGCSRRGLGQGGLRLTRRRWIDPTPVLDHEVSQPRDIPYPPEQLAEMMNMSVELQQAQLSDYEMRMRKAVNLRQFRHGGSGEPTAERFWLGQYNEVLVDSEHYRSSLPRSIAGVFYVAGGGGETCAIKAHEFLTAHYRLKPEQLLLLMHKPGESPAFEEHGRPQGAPSRTQHPSSGSDSIPLAGFPRTTATPSTSSASASTSAHSSESRGGGGGGGHSEAWRRKHAQPPADDSMLKGQFASVESQSSLPERRPQPDDRRPITAQAVAVALAAPTPPEAVALAAGPGIASRGASSAVHAPSAPASAPSSTIAELEGMFDAAPAARERAAPHASSHANLLRPSRQDYWAPSAPTIALDLADLAAQATLAHP